MRDQRVSDELAIILSSIDYIEAHLKEKVGVDQIAAYAGFSRFHFSRVFDKWVDMSPYDYYRGRKVTETIRYMQERECKIIDAAYEYGFSSPEVFVRACKAVFEASPSAIRKRVEQGLFVGIQRIDERALQFAGDYNQEPELKFLPSLTLAGFGYFSQRMEETIKELPKEQLESFGTNNSELYKISWLQKNAMGYMHFVGKRHTGGEDVNALTKSVPRMSYLMFGIPKGDDMASYLEYVFTAYLPSSEYEQALPYYIETYIRETGVNTLYLPVVPKE